ncbi:hypothetical protein RHGRI_019217 [Rhododendron griersonianum]|uniref:Uncharacterized protein n=1 Tax=Rhododendron griersonianum TaxID=479676 RepID=A0AAV6JG50_9ERIC|nr:hypothetical protein RHGRI_019217 [Rhododendron griersonianum]
MEEQSSMTITILLGARVRATSPQSSLTGYRYHKEVFGKVCPILYVLKFIHLREKSGGKYDISVEDLKAE